MLREFLDPAVPEDECPLPTGLVREDEGAFSHSEEEYEEDIIEPRTLNEITTVTDKTSPWSSVVSEEETGPEQQLVDLGPGHQRSVGIECLRRGGSRQSSFSSASQGDNQSVVTTLSPCVGLHTGEESPWAGAEGFQSLNSGTEPENGSCDCDRAFNATSVDQNVEFRAVSEELMGFPADPKTTEKEEKGEVVNKDHKDEEERGSDEICVTMAGWGGNTESFSDDSSEDSLEAPKKSVKAKIALSDAVVVPNFFLSPQQMETSMRLLSVSSHPSTTLQGSSGSAPRGIPYRRPPPPRPAARLSQEETERIAKIFSAQLSQKEQHR